MKLHKKILTDTKVRDSTVNSKHNKGTNMADLPGK